MGLRNFVANIEDFGTSVTFYGNNQELFVCEKIKGPFYN